MNGQVARLPLIGERAPAFAADSTQGPIRFPDEYKGLKNVEVTFPVISDLTMEVSQTFGMLQPSASTTQAVRAVFIIDPKAVVRAILYYPLTNGRNVNEILRLLVAIQTSDEYKVATPANWRVGEDVIIPPPGSCGSAQERVDNAGSDYQCSRLVPVPEEIPRQIGRMTQHWEAQSDG